jgi:hypothetical protein
MQNNIYKINLIFRGVLGLLVLSVICLGLFVYSSDPITNYTAMYQLFLVLAIVLVLVILSLILVIRIKIFKNLSFMQEVYKHAWNSLVFGFAGAFGVLLAYTSSLSTISGGIVLVCLAAYCAFEFLE